MPRRPRENYTARNRRTPEETRFKKGHKPARKSAASSNSALSIRAALDKALNRKVSISISGTVSKLTVMEVIQRKVLAKAMGGDMKAVKLILDALKEAHESGKFPAFVIYVNGVPVNQD